MARQSRSENGIIHGVLVKTQIVLLLMLGCMALAVYCAETPDPPYDVAPWPAGDSLKMPEFPTLAYTARVEGEVDLLLFIDKSGKKTIGSSAENPKSLGFMDSVETAIQTWQFTPAQHKNRPISTWINLHFVFRYVDENILNEMLKKHFNIIDNRTKWLKVNKTHAKIAEFQPPVIVYVSPHVKIDTPQK
jgi:hypothetical protein